MKTDNNMNLFFSYIIRQQAIAYPRKGAIITEVKVP